MYMGENRGRIQNFAEKKVSQFGSHHTLEPGKSLPSESQGRDSGETIG